MINPDFLETAPDFVRDDWTVMVMDVSVNDEDFDLVKNTLQQIQPEMLLFTRRLKKINITLEHHDGKRETTVYSVDTPNPEFPHVHAIRSGKTKQSTNYFVHKMLVNDMPEDANRQGVLQSGIALAFPFNETSGPIIADQHIFAFMPLRETSLPVRSSHIQ
jgi:hypothetical protein